MKEIAHLTTVLYLQYTYTRGKVDFSRVISKSETDPFLLSIYATMPYSAVILKYVHNMPFLKVERLLKKSWR